MSVSISSILSDLKSGSSGNQPMFSTGWAVAVACIGGVLLSSTPAGPYVLGVLGIALIYQTGLMIKGQ